MHIAHFINKKNKKFVIMIHNNSFLIQINNNDLLNKFL